MKDVAAFYTNALPGKGFTKECSMGEEDDFTVSYVNKQHGVRVTLNVVKAETRTKVFIQVMPAK